MSERAHRRRVAAGTVVAILVLGSGARSATVPDDLWRSKLHPRLLDAVPGAQVEFLIVVEGEADLTAARRLPEKTARGRYVFETLRRHSETSQAELRTWLARRNVEHRPFWIANLVWARGSHGLLEELARRPDVRRLDPNPRVRLDVPPGTAGPQGTQGPRGIEGSLLRIHADVAWAAGSTGSGVVVAGEDTGYAWTHPALIGSYRGWDGATASHDHNWHDAIHQSNGPCGANAPAPCDDAQHGTHTMGTIVGDDGGVNRIGVAPGARWIGCRNMDQGVGTPASYTECFQWFVAPTDLAGQNPDPALAPDVINNSWACPPQEGCAADALRAVVEATRAAGIVVVSAAGNAGSSCATIQDPPAIYAASLTVGATDATDTIASFSSRGPVNVDGSGRRKPDLTAPGVGIRSSVPGGGYQVKNGTSMAAPHVAGAIALLLSARPDLRGRVEDIETLLARSANPVPSLQSCGGDVPGLTVPNNVYGHGLLDVEGLWHGDADDDGIGNLEDCAPLDTTTWAAPGPLFSLRLDRRAGTTLEWSAPALPGSTDLRYDVLRSPLAHDFSAAACLLHDSAATSVADAQIPGTVAFYLVRSGNACGQSLGTASDGTPRSAPACP